MARKLKYNITLLEFRLGCASTYLPFRFQNVHRLESQVGISSTNANAKSKVAHSSSTNMEYSTIISPRRSSWIRFVTVIYMCTIMQVYPAPWWHGCLRAFLTIDNCTLECRLCPSVRPSVRASCCCSWPKCKKMLKFVLFVFFKQKSVNVITYRRGRTLCKNSSTSVLPSFDIRPTNSISR